MIPIVRYAFVKSVREKSLLPFLLAPAVFLGAPMLGLFADALVHHQRAFPMRIPTLSLAETDTSVLFTCTILVAATSGAAAFWVFRNDIVNRSVSFFILSCRYSVAIPASAVVFAVVIAIASFLLAWPLTVISAGAIPAGSARAFALAIACACACACAGILLATLAPAPGTLIVFPIIAAPLVVFAYFHSAFVIVATTCVLSAVLSSAAAIVMERRCAA